MISLVNVNFISLNRNIQAAKDDLTATNDLIWDTGYVAQPYYFGVPTGEICLAITSDGAMWIIASMSTGFNIVRLNNIESNYLLSGNATDRVITVKTKNTNDNIRIMRIRFKPRYK